MPVSWPISWTKEQNRLSTWPNKSNRLVAFLECLINVGKHQFFLINVKIVTMVFCPNALHGAGYFKVIKEISLKVTYFQFCPHLEVQMGGF